MVHQRGSALDEFLIPCAARGGGLLFYQRSPMDPTEPIDEYWVRVTDHNLSVCTQVYASYIHSHPAPLFSEMARRWSGWPGELIWSSLEGEFELRCTHDRLGHISICVKLASGHIPGDWRIIATVMTEAGQLQRIARSAELFFGRSA
jgi:hypothetical protein